MSQIRTAQDRKGAVNGLEADGQLEAAASLVERMTT
jgi:hypothetical protein